MENTNNFLPELEEANKKLEEEKIKNERIRQRERLSQALKEQNDQNSQDELFSKMENFKNDKEKKTN